MLVTTNGRNAACQALVDLFDAASPTPGYIEIRSGTPPTSAEDVATGTLLATAVLPDPGFGTAGTSGPGIALAEPIDVVVGVGDGAATWFRAYDGNDVPVEDGTASVSGAGGELQLNTTTISVGVDVAVTSWAIVFPES